MRLAMFAAGILLAIATPAETKTPAGETVKVKPLAELVTGGNGKKLKARQPVYSGDTIRTSLMGEAQIIFRDQTRLVIGPGANLKIDSFVTGGNNKAKRFAVKAFAGAFRFVSGRSGKKAYSINTPTAIIGVRGTAFDFSVGRGGRTLVMRHSGLVQVCSTAGGCRTLDDACEIVLTRPGQPPQHTNEPGFLLRRNELSRAFPYVRSQRSLRQGFRVPGAHRCRSVTTQTNDVGGGSGGNSSGGASGRN